MDLPISLHELEVADLLAGRLTSVLAPVARSSRDAGRDPRRVGPGAWRWAVGDGAAGYVRRCPYGDGGTTLWVRERWGVGGDWAVDPTVSYAADGTQRCVRAADLVAAGYRHVPGWRSPQHMPRWASRCTLAVTAVAVARLHDLAADAAQGGTADLFRERWAAVHQAHAPWSRNPWCWVVHVRDATGYVAGRAAVLAQAQRAPTADASRRPGRCTRCGLATEQLWPLADEDGRTAEWHCGACYPHTTTTPPNAVRVAALPWEIVPKR